MRNGRFHAIIPLWPGEGLGRQVGICWMIFQWVWASDPGAKDILGGSWWGWQLPACCCGDCDGSTRALETNPSFAKPHGEIEPCCCCSIWHPHPEWAPGPALVGVGVAFTPLSLSVCLKKCSKHGVWLAPWWRGAGPPVPCSPMGSMTCWWHFLGASSPERAKPPRGTSLSLD